MKETTEEENKRFSEMTDQYLEESSVRSMSSGTLSMVWASKEGSRANSNVTKISYRLQPQQAMTVAVVLEELSDKLAIVGKGLTVPIVDLRTASSIQFDKFHRPLVNLNKKASTIQEELWLLKQRYDTVLPRRLRYIGADNKLKRTQFRNVDTDITNLTMHGKIEICRVFAQEVVDKIVAELVQDFTFQPLISAIDKEKMKNIDKENLIKIHLNHKVEIKRLKMDLKNVKLHVVAETKRFKNALWTLQDSLQEHNVRSDMESVYISNSCIMRRAKSKKICCSKENKVQEALLNLKKRYRLEASVHQSMVDIINKIKADSEAKLGYWVEKYETDKENLLRALDVLKAERGKCLDRIAWIHQTMANYKPIVKDNRRVKKIEANRIARQELMTKKAIRVQAWWRGTMVRNALGPYSKKSMEKADKRK